MTLTLATSLRRSSGPVFVLAAMVAVIDGTAPPTVARGAQAGMGAASATIQRLIEASGAEVAIAFRTLDGRDQLFVGPDVSFHAASTMKVPVMVELFRQAKAGALDLDAPLPVHNAFKSIVDGSPFTLQADEDSDGVVYQHVGGTMTARELCEHMITVSSNLATNLLIERLGVDNVRRTVEGLGAKGVVVRRGVEDDKAFQQGLNNTTTARGLLTLFEQIADGAVVDQASSQAMVEILARQHFRDGLPAGLPAGVRVAHKTGEITKIHHDGGIVFAERPYVIVVLVRGIADRAVSARLIADISRALFEATNPA